VSVLWRRRRSELDFAEEIESHIDHEADRLMREGMSAAEARATARRSFGSVARARERYRGAKRRQWLERGAEDLRYAFRTLRREPAFAAAGVLTLALGIGFNTAVFTTLYALVLRPLPLPDADRLVTLHHRFEGRYGRAVNGMPSMASYPEYQEYRERARTLEGLAAYARIGVTLGGEQPLAAAGMLASCDYFDVLRTRMTLGRGFAGDECDRRADGVAVLSHGFWVRQFASDSSILGRTLTVNRQVVTVIGVVERGFGGTELQAPELWMPVTMRPRLSSGGESLRGTMLDARIGEVAVARDQPVDDLSDPNQSWLSLVGRLRPGATPADARAELTAVARQADLAYPGRITSVDVYSASRLNHPETRSLGGLGVGLATLAITGTIVLMACLNVMNLLLARAPVRQRTIRIRLALGAHRRRVIAQLMTESAVLGILGGAAGLALAAWLPRLVLPRLPLHGLQLDLSPDLRVFGYALAVSLTAAVVFGLAPALETTRIDLASAMRGDRVGGRGLRGSRLRQAIVAMQLSGSLALLVLCSLFVRAVLHAQSSDPGFFIERVYGLRPSLREQGYDATRAADFYRQLEQRAAVLPGVESVALAQWLPLSARSVAPLVREGETEVGSSRLHVSYMAVAASYFPALGIPILRGRAFSQDDARPSNPVPVVVSAAMAARVWPGDDALRKRFRTGSRDLEVVGIARDARTLSLSDPRPLFFYAPLQLGFADPDDGGPVDVTLIVRSTDRASIDPALTRIVTEIDPAVVTTLESLEQRVTDQIAPTRLAALFAGVLGLLAATLAAVGVYSAMSYSASQRTREIGVRLALGATPRAVTWMVLRDGASPVLLGLAAGIVLAAAAAQLARGQLFGLSTLDPIAFLSAAALLSVTALVAMYRPARRAAGLDPAATLRSE
jgi:predicted permease